MAEPFRDIEEASKRARFSYFWFTIFGFYLALVAGATTHEQLIRGTAMTMPTLQVGLPIKGFYVIVPPILVLLHAQLLYYLKALADKIAAGGAGMTPAQAPGPLSRYIVDNLFKKNQADLTDSTVNSLIKIGVWLSAIVFPLLLLLLVQVRFLPYHHNGITWWHRALVIADLVLVWAFWIHIVKTKKQIQIIDGDINKNKKWLAKFRKHFQIRGLFLKILTLLCIVFSLLIATIPNEPLDRLGYLHGVYTVPEKSCKFTNLATYIATIDIPAPSVRGPKRQMGCLTYLLFEAPTTPLDMRRNLRLPNIRLVDPAMADQIPEEMNDTNTYRLMRRGVDLRGRDLRYADLSGAQLQQADLRGADLTGADLKRADLRLADLGDIATTEFTACRNPLTRDCEGAAKKGQFCRTTLDRVRLEEADLRFARLREAHLPEADLSYAWLDRVDLQCAGMQKAILRGTRLQGAHAAKGQFQGADLQNAKATGADFTMARFDGASKLERLSGEFTIWNDARFGGADLSLIRLNGALMRGADLTGSNLEGAEFFAASLQRAKLSRLPSEPIAFAMADLQDSDYRDRDQEMVQRNWTIVPASYWQPSWDAALLPDGQKEWDTLRKKQADLLCDQTNTRDADRWVAYGLARRVIREAEEEAKQAKRSQSREPKSWHITLAGCLLGKRATCGDGISGRRESQRQVSTSRTSEALPGHFKAVLDSICEFPRIRLPDDNSTSAEGES